MKTIATTILPISCIQRNEGQIEGLPANPRVIRDAKFELLKQSIKDDAELLVLREVLVRKTEGDNYIAIGGNMRLEALKAIGAQDVPCKIIPEDWSLDKLKSIILKDNSAYGEWDWDALANQFDEDLLKAAAIDLPTDFDVEDPERKDAQDDDFDEENEDIKARCISGDIWQLGRHRLLCGDSTKKADVEKLLGGAKADLWLTDPPYNVNYQGGTEDKLKIQNDNMESEAFFAFLRDAFTAAGSVLKAGAPFYIWFASREHINFEKALNTAGFQVRQELIWVKNSLVLGRQDYQWRHEPCLYGWKDGASHKWYSDRSQSTILEFDKPKRSDLHPTMKPIPLFSYQIQNSTKEEDIVLDTFGGSGTTIICCEQINRTAYSCEIDPHYCDVILARWEKLTGQTATKLN